MLRGIAAYARPHRPWVITWEGPTLDGLRRLWELGLDGIIAKHLAPSCEDFIMEHRIPAVFLGAPANNAAIGSVYNDEPAVGALAAQYFLGRGYKHFACYGRLAGSLPERGTAFAAAVTRAGHTPHIFDALLGHPGHPTSSVTLQGAEAERLRADLLRLPKPLAVFCIADNPGLLLAEQCRILGLVVPHEVAILGVDNDVPVCELAYPPLSSIQTPSEQIGWRGAELLDQMATEGKPARNVELPPVRVVTRRSTDTVVASDPLVVKALEYLRANFTKPTCVPSVFDEVACSRRTLERKFFASIGLTPAEAWMRFRVEEAQRLLADTDHSLEEVAVRAGFSDLRQLQFTFRKLLDQTPSEFRRHAAPSLSGKR